MSLIFLFIRIYNYAKYHILLCHLYTSIKCMLTTSLSNTLFCPLPHSCHSLSSTQIAIFSLAFWKIYMLYNIYLSESSLFYLPWFHFCFLHIFYDLIYSYDWVNSNLIMFHIFFIRSSMDGHLGWFYFLAIVAIAEISTSSQVSWLCGKFKSFTY